MPSQKDRINTIIALLRPNAAITSSSFNMLKAEFSQIYLVDSISPMTRRNLMKVLHSTRALDTTLKTIITYYNLGAANSLGPLIDKFRNHNNPNLGQMSRRECEFYKRSIADIRNKHLHKAGSYPRNEGEVSNLLSEMEALVARVSNL
jgi:hypothetical protein